MRGCVVLTEKSSADWKKEGKLLEPRSVYAYIAEILTISYEEAKELSNRQREQFKLVQELFTELSFGGSKQWLGSLAVRLPPENYDGLKANPNATLKFNGSEADSSAETEKHAWLRLMFLRGLFDLTSDEEREKYSDLLEPRLFMGRLAQDPKVIGTIKLIEDCYNELYTDAEQKLLGLPEYASGRPLEPGDIKGLSVAVAGDLLNFLDSWMTDQPGSENDSLAAQLILNSAVNTAVLEYDELARLHAEAQPEMESVVSLLADAIPDGSIDGCSEAERALLMKNIYGALESQKTAEKGRAYRLSDSVREIIEAKADMLIEQFCLNRSNGRIEEFRELHGNPHNRLLMAACLAWAYWAELEHDLGIVGRSPKKDRVITRRSSKEKLEMPPSMIAYLLRQYALLIYSNQHEERSLFNLRRYSAAFAGKRSMLRYVLVRMKEASLAQWRAVADTLWAPVIKAHQEGRLG